MLREEIMAKIDYWHTKMPAIGSRKIMILLQREGYGVGRKYVQNCQIICCSALLTATMGVMEDVVKKAEEAGIRDKVKIMIGGAPVDEAFCKKIGADCYTPDAASAADAAVEFCRG